MRASGTFDVKLAPVGSDSTPEGPNLARLSIDKVFKGDLDGVSKGEMITAAGIAVKESAAYSAVERVTGTLHGKKGSFALQHTGIMDRGKPSLTITVVPDSGTGALVGLTGKMDIIIEGKEHKYVFEYAVGSLFVVLGDIVVDLLQRATRFIRPGYLRHDSIVLRNSSCVMVRPAMASASPRSTPTPFSGGSTAAPGCRRASGV